MSTLTETEPRILGRSEHSISRRDIDSDALKVLRRLSEKGFETYLVGGGVRDLLLKRRPKDYDIATAARPEQVRKLFRNSRIIGRRFRLAHVYFHSGIVEVSTFRSAPDRNEQRGGPQDLLVTNDNKYGTPREDAFRRDITINALYYRTSDFSLVDYVGGLKDLDRRLIRIIGDPDVRFREDPVRMMRCCELAARLGFRIEPRAQESIRRNRSELEKAAPPRIREELFQILHCGAAGPALQLMLELGLLDLLLPEAHAMVEAEAAGLGSFDRVVPAIDRGRPERMDDVVLLGAILAPNVYLELVRRQQRADPESAPPRARDVVQAATSDFMQRLAVPNAKSQRTTRALEVLLRLQDLPEDKWERRRVTRFAAFRDALRILRLLTRATGNGEEIYRQWRAEARDKSDVEAPPRKRKKRRRRRPKPS